MFKQFIISALCAGWSGLGFAQSQIVFNPSHGDYYRVFLDGKLQHEFPHRGIFVLKGIPEGNYQLLISTEDKKHPCAQAQPQFIEVGKLKSLNFQQASDCQIKLVDNIPLAKSAIPTNISTYIYTNNGEFKQGSSNSQSSLSTTSLDSKRTGEFKLVEWTDENGISRLIPSDSVDYYRAKSEEKKQIANTSVESVVTSYRYETNEAGQQYVMRVKTIVSKSLVERNGQKYYKTSEKQEINPTSYVCVPMSDQQFLDFYQNLPMIAQDSNTFAGKCFHEEQIAKIIGLQTDEARKQQTAVWLQNSCAEPSSLQPFLPKETPKNTVTEASPKEPSTLIEIPKADSSQNNRSKPLTRKEQKNLAKAEKKAEKERIKAEKAQAKAEKAAKAAAEAQRRAQKAAAQ